MPASSYFRSALVAVSMLTASVYPGAAPARGAEACAQSAATITADEGAIRTTLASL